MVIGFLLDDFKGKHRFLRFEHLISVESQLYTASVVNDSGIVLFLKDVFSQNISEEYRPRHLSFLVDDVQGQYIRFDKTFDGRLTMCEVMIFGGKSMPHISCQENCNPLNER